MSAIAKWRTLKCRPVSIRALMCAAFTAISTISNAQVGGSQPQGLTLKADPDTLCALVGKMQVLAFRYSDDPDAEDPRQLEPYAVGYTKAGNALLFGFQTKGYSKSAASGAGELPGWRNFRIDKIKMRTVDALNSTFKPTRWKPSRSISDFVCKTEAFP
jgi:hypothetical protein